MESFMQTVLDSEDVVIVTKAEHGYPIVFVNKAFTQQTGYLLEEVVGRSPSLLQGKDTSEVAKEKIKHDLSMFKPVRQEILNYTKIGEAYITELSIFPHYTDGKCTHFVSVQRDTGMRTRLEYKMNEYKKFFDDTPVALLRTDIRTGEFLMANNFCAELLGYPSVQELMANEKTTNLYRTKEARRKMINKIKKQGFVQDYEIEFLLRDNRTVWISANLHINCGGSCLEGSLIDITDRKEVEVELETLKARHLENLSKINNHLENVLVSYK